LFFDPAAGMDDFSDRFGGFFCPHFDQEGTTIIQALQGGKDSGKSTQPSPILPLGTTNFLAGIVAFSHGYIRVFHALRINNRKVFSSWHPCLRSAAVP